MFGPLGGLDLFHCGYPLLTSPTPHSARIMRTLSPATSASDGSVSRIGEKVPHLITHSDHQEESALSPFLGVSKHLASFLKLGLCGPHYMCIQFLNQYLILSPEVSLSGHSVVDIVQCGSGKGRTTINSNTSWKALGSRKKIWRDWWLKVRAQILTLPCCAI